MGLFESLDNITPEEEIPTNVDLNIKFSTLEYTYDTFLKKLETNNITDVQIENEILYYYNNLCNYDRFKHSETRTTFQKIWTNERFLNVFCKLCPRLMKDPDFQNNGFYNHTICKIAYDYYSEYGNKEGMFRGVTSVLFRIVETLNANQIIPLTAYMNEIHAMFIILASKSSFDPYECVQRVNEFIMRLGYDFDISTIVYIYSLLYSKKFSELFIATMIQTYDLDTLDTNEKTMYYRINRTLLMILNSMPSGEICTVIKRYDNFLNLEPHPVRFNLMEKAREYERLYDNMLHAYD